MALCHFKRVKNASSTWGGIEVLNVSSVLNGLYKDKGVLPRGYANASGPGMGHLNVDGIEAVFSYVSKYLKDKYAL